MGFGLVTVNMVVIPGRAEGANPESRIGTSHGPWIPGSLAALAPRNDIQELASISSSLR
jgi:hypothetical protein